MNLCTLIATGNQTADPTLTQRNGTDCCHFTVAVNTAVKDAEGNYIANFFDVTAWGKLALATAKIRKGDKIAFTGDLVVKKYVDRQGLARFSNSIRLISLDNSNRGSNSSSPSNVMADDDSLPI